MEKIVIWICRDDNGKPVVYTFSHSEKDSKEKATKCFQNLSWNQINALGWVCQRVELTINQL